MTPVVKQETGDRIYHDNVFLFLSPENWINLGLGQHIFLSHNMQLGILNHSYIDFNVKTGLNSVIYSCNKIIPPKREKKILQNLYMFTVAL